MFADLASMYGAGSVSPVSRGSGLYAGPLAGPPAPTGPLGGSPSHPHSPYIQPPHVPMLGRPAGPSHHHDSMTRKSTRRELQLGKIEVLILSSSTNNTFYQIRNLVKMYIFYKNLVKKCTLFTKFRIW